MKHRVGCPLGSVSVASTHDGYENDAISLRPIENYRKEDVETLKPQQKPIVCTWGKILFFDFLGQDNVNLAGLLNYQDEDYKRLHPFELPIITKVYDFNPDYPSLQNCLLDIESYKRIIGAFEKGKTPQASSSNFNGYDSDYGKQHFDKNS